MVNDKLVTQLPDEDTADMKAGDIMKLEAGVRRVTLMIGKSGGLAEGGDPVRIQYGTADLTKKPVAISTRAEGTPESDEDGLSIRGYFKVSGERGFRQRDAGTIWVDITNVEDGTGTASITPSPALVRAGSKKNLITVTYTGTGTMDGGAVRFTIPDDWGAMQDDPLERNYIEVDAAGSGATLEGDPEIVDDGLAVEVNLKTFGKGHKVTFTYGGGTGSRDNRGAEAQVELGEATFMIESFGGGSDNEGFVDITVDDEPDTDDPLTIEVKGAESGSGDGTFEIMSTKCWRGSTTVKPMWTKRYCKSTPATIAPISCLPTHRLRLSQRDN